MAHYNRTDLREGVKLSQSGHKSYGLLLCDISPASSWMTRIWHSDGRAKIATDYGRALSKKENGCSSRTI